MTLPILTALPGERRGYVDGPDGQIHYRSHGEGPPLLLVHQAPWASIQYRHALPRIAAAGFRAIAYDRRGFGRSDQPWSGYDYDTFADDLADVMKETGADKDATIVGFSMGGGEVARYMARHEGRGVIGAALIGSVVPYMLQTPDNPDGVPQSVFDQMAEGMKADRPAFFRDFFKAFFGVGALTSPVSEARLDWAWRLAMQAGRKPTLGCAEAFASTDFRPDLPAFRVPTLIVHGTGDQIVPIDVSARAAAKGIAGAQLVEYDDAPHGLFATHGERLTKDLLTFLGR